MMTHCPCLALAAGKAARRILRHFHQLGWPQEVPPGEPGLRQRDSVSCGLYCLHWAEAILREFRGEGPSPSTFVGGDRLKTLRSWLGYLEDKKDNIDKKEGVPASKGVIVSEDAKAKLKACEESQEAAADFLD